MTVYNAPGYDAASFVGPVGDGGALKVVRFGQIALTAALTTADSGTFGYVPRGFVVTDFIFKPSDIDSSTGVTLNLGDTGSATRLLSASTAGQTGTVVRGVTLPVAAVFYQYTARTAITWACAANATSGVAGTLDLALIGYFSALVFS
jgi:endoglucanase Acf2